MKLLAFLFVLMTSTMAFSAETVRVVSDSIPNTPYYTRSDAKFYMDQGSSLGYAQVEVTEEMQVTRWETVCNGPYDPRFPHPGCRQYPRTYTEYRTIYQHTELIPNLVLEGNKIVYNGEAGAVECGTLGESRVFRRPTLYLNGKCSLKSAVIRDRADRKVIVDFQVRN